MEHEFVGYPHEKLFTAISVSVEKLSEPVATRYKDLAVFPADVPIPVSVLPRFGLLERRRRTERWCA